jgi:EXLDI family protein
LRHYVASESVAESGDIVVKVGTHRAYVQKRFKGRLMGKQSVASADQSRMLHYSLYETPKHNFAVAIRDTPNWYRRNWSRHREDNLGDWWAPTFRLEIYGSLDELQSHIPTELYAVAVNGTSLVDGIEDLDI